MRELRLFFTALMFFTRIPCGRWAGSSQDDLNRASRYFPWVGILIGVDTIPDMFRTTTNVTGDLVAATIAGRGSAVARGDAEHAENTFSPSP